MLNFTVGPVVMGEAVTEVGGEQVPYFRTPEFSALMKENEHLMKALAGADKTSRALFLTGSGTAAMEAAVINCFTKKDRVLVVNGGSFGQRFADICRIHELSYEEISLEHGRTLKKEQLYRYDGKGFTGMLVNVHETSTGVLYDIDMISEFCKKNGIFLVVDAISSFLADELDMSALGIDVFITSSQKALACPPGISILVLSARATERIQSTDVKSLYFDLRTALKDGERGQTPFTPAITVLRQINVRLRHIEESGGVRREIMRVAELARDFREKIKGLPFDIYSEHMSNAVTALCPRNVSAYEIFKILKEKHEIWVCPNGGALADKVFRVGHIGALTKDDNTTLVNAFCELQRQGLI